MSDKNFNKVAAVIFLTFPKVWPKIFALLNLVHISQVTWILVIKFKKFKLRLLFLEFKLLDKSERGYTLSWGISRQFKLGKLNENSLVGYMIKILNGKANGESSDINGLFFTASR